jgi:hypothetical protein
MTLNTDGSLTSLYNEASGPHRGEQHLFTKTARGTTSGFPVGGVYAVTYGAPSSVTIHPASDGEFTISVNSGSSFRFQGASCDLLPTAVIGTFGGPGTHAAPDFTGTALYYDPTSCAFDIANGAFHMHLNDDGTLTSLYGEASGPHRGEQHLFTKTADIGSSTKPIGGTYNVTYASAGAVTITRSGTTFTVTVSTPFKFFGATCELPVGAELSTFTGTAQGFRGKADIYDPSSCALSGSDNVYQMQLNDDGTLTSTYGEASGPRRGESHLFTPA